MERTSQEKILELDKIFRNHGFKLDTYNMKIVDSQELLQDMISKPLSIIADEQASTINCLKEMVRVIYNIQDIDEL